MWLTGLRGGRPSRGWGFPHPAQREAAWRPTRSWGSSTSRRTRSPTAGAFERPTGAVAHGRAAGSPRARRSSTSAASRPGPGADPVPRRGGARAASLPVVEGVGALGLAAQISIDTTKVEVARAALDAGATYVNDVTAFRHEPGARRPGRRRAACDCCLMHMLGEPRTMQDDPRYDDVVADVKAFLEERLGVRGRARACPRSGSSSTPGSASARRSSTTSSCCAASDELVALGRPAGRSARRASRSSAGSPAATSTERVAGDGRHERARARARGARVPRPRRRAARGRAGGGRCYVGARDGAATTPTTSSDDDLSDDEDSTTDDEGPEIGVTIEIVGLSLYTHHGVTRGRARDRPAPRARRAASTSARSTRWSPTASRTPSTTARSATGDRADRPAALLQDARAPVRGDRRPPARRVRRREPCRSRPPSPSRRSRCRSRRSRSRCGARSAGAELSSVAQPTRSAPA